VTPRETARDRKARKRAEAEARNARTRPERRRAVRRRGCPTGKQRYATESAARTELVGTVIAKNRGKQQRRECRTYLCPMCGGWHLTSAPERRRSA
jgi:hypothetical protein